jgi:hypothetical protein
LILQSIRNIESEIVHGLIMQRLHARTKTENSLLKSNNVRLILPIVASSTARRRLGCMDGYNTATGDDKVDVLYSYYPSLVGINVGRRSSVVGRQSAVGNRQSAIFQ